MTTIDRTVVSPHCDLKMINIGSGGDGWRIFVRELGKDMPAIADVLGEFSYGKLCGIAQMPAPWHRESKIDRFVSGPETKEEAQELLVNIFSVYNAYKETRTPRMLLQEHMSNMQWLTGVLDKAGEENLAEILISFIADMTYNEE